MVAPPGPRLLHWPLATVTLVLAALGTTMVTSAGRGPTGDLSLGLRQAVFLGLGTVAMLLTAAVDHRHLRRWARPLTAAVVVALVLVLTPLGTEVRGTRGWFHVAGVAVQPSELAKPVLVLALAAVLDGSWGPDGRPARAGLPPGPLAIRPIGAGPARFAGGVALVGGLSLLVLAQGETGTVLVYGAVTLGMFTAAGVPWRFLALLTATGVGAVALALSSGLLAPYQVARFEAFLDPNLDPLGIGYNQQQALTAIGSGGWTGAGLFDGPQTQLGYLPDQHTDFIFAAIGEELGLVGALAVLVLEAAVLALVFLTAVDARDGWGRLICLGSFSLLAFEVVQNVAMNLRLAPITGIALPFVSYGGSSLVSSLVTVGLVQSVAVHQGPRRPAWAVSKARTGRWLR